MASRRRFLARLSTGFALPALGTLAGCTFPGTNDGSSGTDEPGDGSDSGSGGSDDGDGSDGGSGDRPTSVGTELVADGFVAPIAVEQPSGDDRLFVADQPGRLYVVGADGRKTEFLDLRERIVDVGGYDERGLLGLAFHPDYAENGRFYVRYSAPRRDGTPDNFDHTGVLAEFTVDADDPTTAASASRASERSLLEVPEPQSNHNGGAIVFGPDGYLYVGLGDGGAANDQGRGHVEDWYVPNAGGNGQDVTENLLGSILRIDVDTRTGDRPYGIPDDNPLVDSEGLDEHYAWGLRNPWRMSFDVPESGSDSGANQTQDGSGDGEDLYVADVGQSAWEEVNLVTAGGNYGWNVREGAHCFGTDDCPTSAPDGSPLVDPVLEYGHGDEPVSGAAIVGGYVARDGALPGFDGHYVFADWQSQGRLFAADTTKDAPWSPWVVTVEGDIGPFVLAFGRDTDGTLYACTSDASGIDGETGAIYRLTAP